MTTLIRDAQGFFWRYLISPQIWIKGGAQHKEDCWELKKNQQKAYTTNKAKNNYSGLEGRSDKTTYFHTTEIDWSVSQNNPMALKIVMYNLSDWHARVVNKDYYWNLNNKDDRIMKVHLELEAYKYTYSGWADVQNCYTTGYPTRKTIFTCSMPNLTSLTRGLKRGNKIKLNPTPNMTKGQAIEQIAKQFGLSYNAGKPYQNDCDYGNSELLGSGFRLNNCNNMYDALYEINNKLWYYEEVNKNKKSVLRTALNLGELMDGRTKHTAIKKQLEAEIQTYANKYKIDTTNKNYAVIDATLGEVIGIPHFTEKSAFVQMELVLRLDLAPGDYVKVKLNTGEITAASGNDKNAELMTLFSASNGGTTYQVQSVHHRIRFSNSTGCSGQTTLLLTNIDEVIREVKRTTK